MKKIKVLILLCCLILMTGCGYDDVYKEYKEVLDNLDCNYVASEYGASEPYPSKNYKINFSADSTGFYIDLNGTKKPLYDKDGIHSAILGDYRLKASEDILKEFLDKYKNNGNTCPTQFFAKVLLEDPTTAEIATSCSAGDGVTGACFLYTKQNSNSETNELVKSKIYKRYSDVLNKEIQIRFGYNQSTQKSYLYMDNIEYEFDGKSLFTPIQNYNKYIKVDSTDYDGIFKINGNTVRFPTTIYLGREVGTTEVLAITTDSDKYNLYDEGEDLPDEEDPEETDEPIEREPTDAPVYDVKDTSVGEICSDPKYRKTAKFIGTIVNFIRIAVPVVIIIFGIMDLYKAITGSKDDEIKKSLRSIMIRVIAGMFVFLLPGIVQFFFNMLNKWSDYKMDVCCCTECILNSDCNVNSCNSESCKIEGTN